MKHFKYRKSDGTVTERFAHPMGVVDDKLFTVDLTEFSTKEREEYEEILKSIHTQYVQAIKDVGLGTSFRYFFFEGIDEI